MDDQQPSPTPGAVELASGHDGPDMTPMPVAGDLDMTPAGREAGTDVEPLADEETLPDLPSMTAPDTADADVRDLPLAEIAEIANIRPTYFGVEELSESMRVQGQLEPCLVRAAPADATHGMPWELVFGYRRKRAAETLGWQVLRCQVREISDSEVLEIMLTENLQREDLSAIASAKTMRALIDLGGMKQAEVARRLGVHPSHVSHSLKLLTLAPPVIDKIDKGEITASHGETLAALPEAQQEAFAERVAKDGISVAKLSSWVRQAKEEEALPPPELPGALEPVTADDVTDLPRLYLREDLSATEHRRATCFALLRNGNDQEILDWLEEREGVDYEGLWSWLRDLDDDELGELERRLVRRYLEAAHRFPSFEPALIADLGDEDALEGRRPGTLTPALDPTEGPGLALPAAPLDASPAEEGAHWADEVLESEDEDAPEGHEGDEGDEGDEAASADEPPAEGDDQPGIAEEPSAEVLLREAFTERQGLSADAAATIAAKLAGADDDIIDAALAWASDGLLPDHPIVEGASPASLGRRLGKPSIVFTALMRLREDPAAARQALVAALRAAEQGPSGSTRPQADLAESFIERQGLERDKAEALAAKIMGADEDIREAALEWAASARMPDTPVIEDETPASLESRLPKPSLVFTALIALRTNPEDARTRIPPRD